MKKISEHLGQIIVALAGVALLVAAVVVFKAPIGEFYHSMIGKETSVADTVLEGLDGIDLGDLSGGPVMLDGNGQTVNKFALGPVRFRSSAPMSELQGVKVNGEAVDPSNYEVSEGSTIIKFKSDYVSSLAAGNHTIDIVSGGGTASGAFAVINEVPDDATIYEGAAETGNLSNATEITPEEFANRAPATGDAFEYGDYRYYYSTHYSWRVYVLDKTKTEYGTVLTSIAGKPVTYMESTFEGCTNLTTAPAIPDSVINMTQTFSGCTNLTTAPAIPEGVTSMRYTFNGCTNLTTAPAIPSSVTSLHGTFEDCVNLTTAPAIPESVTDMTFTFENCTNLTTAPAIPSSVTNLSATFRDCTSLTGTVTINANPASAYLSNCFAGTTQPITLTTIDGACTVLDELAWTATNGNVTYDGAMTFDPAKTEITLEEYGGTEPVSGAVFKYGDYKYAYSSSGWRVFVLDNTKTEYGTVLTSIAGNAVTNMNSTFKGCTNLTTAPDLSKLTEVTNMDYAFENCTALTTAPVIPNKVVSLNSTFKGCTSLTSAPAIPEGVTNMNATFDGCTSLTIAPTLPDGQVSSLGSTFNGCTNLKTYAGSAAPDGDFSGYVIPEGAQTINAMFKNCQLLTVSPAIPSSVTNMSSAFEGCTSLTTAPVIPSKVGYMNRTFYGCTSLTGTITVNGNLKTAAYSIGKCFEGTVLPITLTTIDGACTVLAELAATATNGNVTVQ